MLRDLLVHVDGSESGRRRVQFAVDLAMSTGARLSGIHLTPPADVPPLYKPTRVAEVAAHLSSSLALDARAEEHASLREHIEKGPSDWLVMGGYSRPMWLEFIFGGVTQSMLLSSKIPVLVSH